MGRENEKREMNKLSKALNNRKLGGTDRGKEARHSLLPSLGGYNFYHVMFDGDWQVGFVVVVGAAGG